MTLEAGLLFRLHGRMVLAICEPLVRLNEPPSYDLHDFCREPAAVQAGYHALMTPGGAGRSVRRRGRCRCFPGRRDDRGPAQKVGDFPGPGLEAPGRRAKSARCPARCRARRPRVQATAINTIAEARTGSNERRPVTGTRRWRGPSVAVRAKADGARPPGRRPRCADAVRYTSVDTLSTPSAGPSLPPLVSWVVVPGRRGSVRN